MTQSPGQNDFAHGLRALIFDFDQTLVDSTGPVARCINYALSSMGRPAVSEAVARNTIGLTLVDAFRRLTNDEDPSASDEFRHHFHTAADTIVVGETQLIEGVEPALSRLASVGLSMSIVSTKRRDRIEAILMRLGIVEMFEIVLGGNDVARHKPDPEGILGAIQRLDVELHEVVYVGDHVVDGGAATAAGVGFVGVLTGSASADSLRPYNPLALLSGVDQLPGWLSGV